MARQYYPNGAITFNLYTSGKEYMFSDNTEYIGFYHRTIDGDVYTGGYPSAVQQRLVPYINVSTQGGVYDTIRPINVKTYRAPKIYYPKLKKQDYNKGSFVRYFVRRVNSTNPFADIIEIDKKQFDRVGAATGINKYLYQKFELTWRINGPEYDYTGTDGVKRGGVVTTNQRTVLSLDSKYPGLKYKLVDYREYSVYSSLVPADVLIARTVVDNDPIQPAINITRSELERR